MIGCAHKINREKAMGIKETFLFKFKIQSNRKKWFVSWFNTRISSKKKIHFEVMVKNTPKNIRWKVNITSTSVSYKVQQNNPSSN